ncbi:MAG: hypothetical protein SGPRY_014970, partial [Prymnesium sp.]
AYKFASDSVRGLIPETVWIIQDQVLCGEAPLMPAQLRLLLSKGIDTFIDLRHPSEKQQHGAYAHIARDIARDKGVDPIFADLPIPEELRAGEVADLCAAEDRKVSILVLDVLEVLSRGHK